MRPPCGANHSAIAGLGGSNPPALQWHGLPFPHPQATKLKSSEARQGLSGWFSHTQPVPLQVGQCWIDFAWPSTVSSGFRRSSIGVRSNALSAAFRERPSRSRSDSSLPSISAPLSRLSPGRLRGVPFKPGCLGVAIFKFLACQLRQRVIRCDVPCARTALSCWHSLPNKAARRIVFSGRNNYVVQTFSTRELGGRGRCLLPLLTLLSGSPALTSWCIRSYC